MTNLNWLNDMSEEELKELFLFYPNLKERLYKLLYSDNKLNIGTYVPCKIGDNGYFVNHFIEKIQRATVVEINIVLNQINIVIEIDDKHHYTLGRKAFTNLFFTNLETAKEYGLEVE